LIQRHSEWNHWWLRLLKGLLPTHGAQVRRNFLIVIINSLFALKSRFARRGEFPVLLRQGNLPPTHWSYWLNGNVKFLKLCPILQNSLLISVNRENLKADNAPGRTIVVLVGNRKTSSFVTAAQTVGPTN
jgi:hypothetical protein